MMRPFLIHLTRYDEDEHWRAGFDCGVILFCQDFICSHERDLPGLAADAFIKAAQGLKRHFSLPENEQRAIILRLERAYRED
jgi:hypothetical protein